MSDALNNPVKRKYTRRELNTSDMPITEHDDVDLSFDKPLEHGESIELVAADVNKDAELIENLQFNEEPVTIRIEENARSQFPEPCVQVTVQGKPAEILQNGKWIPIGWLPIGTEVTTRRKYVEVLMRSRSTTFITKHDNAQVETPRNWVEPRTSSNYPVSILEDRNPKGREWVSRIMLNK